MNSNIECPNFKCPIKIYKIRIYSDIFLYKIYPVQNISLTSCIRA